jgi:hypothetical protein
MARTSPAARLSAPPLAAAGFAIKERALGNLAAEHFLQAQRLAAELQTVGVVSFGVPRLYSTG